MAYCMVVTNKNVVIESELKSWVKMKTKIKPIKK